ncbi:MAG: hypothetical protein OSJ58_00185 [Dysosmobacter sp.]|nr:hypothetical protein [Dysosmobacter sp.]
MKHVDSTYALFEKAMEQPAAKNFYPPKIIISKKERKDKGCLIQIIITLHSRTVCLKGFSGKALPSIFLKGESGMPLVSEA